MSTKWLTAELIHLQQAERNTTCCAGLWHWQSSDCCITVTADLTVQEFWRCCFPLSSPGFKCPVCSKSVASNEMEVHFIMCLSKPRLSYNGKTHTLAFLRILLVNNWSLISITISSTTLLIFCVSLYQFILSFSISFLSMIPFRGWKESVNCGWPINLGRSLSLFLFCRGKPRLLLYMTLVIHFIFPPFALSFSSSISLICSFK